MEGDPGLIKGVEKYLAEQAEQTREAILLDPIEYRRLVRQIARMVNGPDLFVGFTESNISGVISRALAKESAESEPDTNPS